MKLGKGQFPINSKNAVKAKRNKHKKEVPRTSAAPEEEQDPNILDIALIESY